MKNDSKLFSILALLMIAGGGVALYFIYFNQPAVPAPLPTNEPNQVPVTPSRPTVNARDFTPEAAGRVDPVVSKKPEQPVALEKPVRRMLVSGRVSDEGGRSLLDVRVEFQGTGELSLFRGTGYTDPAGNYTLLAWERANLRQGPDNDTGGWVYATSPDGRTAACEPQKFSFGSPATMPEIVLKAQALVSGSVLDANGAPAPFVQVTLRSMGVIRQIEEAGGAASYTDRPIVRSATADERGQFEFVSLPPGRYGLSVENSYFGSAVQPTEVDAASGGAQWKELRLTRVNAVFGTLSDEFGAPIDGAVVLLRRKGSGRKAPAKDVEANGESTSGTSLKRRDAERRTDFRASTSAWRCVTDAEGRFGFCNVPDVELELLAQLGKSSVEQTDVRIDQREYSLSMALDCSVAGSVRDAATNLPVSRFDVRIYSGEAEPTPFDTVKEDAVFPWHSFGRYRVLNAPEGTLALRVSAPGYAPAVVTVKDLAAKERRMGVDIALKPLCSLSLTLKSGEKLLSREPVFLLFDGRSVAEASTDDFGEVRLPAVMAADYEIRVQRADGSVLSAKFSVPAQPRHTATVQLAPK